MNAPTNSITNNRPATPKSATGNARPVNTAAWYTSQHGSQKGNQIGEVSNKNRIEPWLMEPMPLAFGNVTCTVTLGEAAKTWRCLVMVEPCSK